MRATETGGGAAPKLAPFSLGPRASGLVALALFLLLPFPNPRPAAGQAAAEWPFEDDAFAELWFHGMAVLGWHGFGALPLYRPEHAQSSRQERSNLGLPPTPLEASRGELRDALRRDEAFEILQFRAALYFTVPVGRKRWTPWRPWHPPGEVLRSCLPAPGLVRP